MHITGLNTPQTRFNLLRDRLNAGGALIVTELAAELGISIDTVRRDFIALEQEGLVRRVRGGAIPVTAPMPSYFDRANAPDPHIAPLVEQAITFLSDDATVLSDDATVFIDAGTTMTALATRISQNFRGLIVTPAPSVALAARHRGARVHLIGGPLSPDGAMATGGAAESTIAQIAADLCFLGACGLWPDFGLSAEDALETGVKRAMALTSAQVIVVSAASKMARRGRHKVLALGEIDRLVTDAPTSATAAFQTAGIEVTHV